MKPIGQVSEHGVGRFLLGGHFTSVCTLPRLNIVVENIRKMTHRVSMGSKLPITITMVRDEDLPRPPSPSPFPLQFCSDLGEIGP